MQNFSLVVNYNPERLISAIPPIVPIEISVDSEHHFQDSPCDGLVVHLYIQVGHMRQQFIHLVLVGGGDVPACLFELPLVEIVHRHRILIQSVNCFLFHITILSHILVGICQLTNVAVDRELPHHMRIRQQPFI